MFDFLSQQKYPIILVALGFLLVLSSFFKIEDISKFQLSPHVAPIYTIFTIGILLILISLLTFLLDTDLEGWLRPAKIKKTESGYTTPLGQAILNVIYGRIESYTDEDSSVVVLPANEFFDDACINDKSSALGAYLQAKFSNQISEIQQLINEKLASVPAERVEKERGVFQQSYGVGTCIFLDRPLKSSQRMILVAVTSQRAGEGLRGEISFNFHAIKEIYKIAADKRLRKVYLPVMGAGHGCLRSEVALFSLAIAWAEILCKPSSPHIQVNIVVFQRDDKTDPEIKPRVVKRVLRMAVGMFGS